MPTKDCCDKQHPNIKKATRLCCLKEITKAAFVFNHVSSEYVKEINSGCVPVSQKFEKRASKQKNYKITLSASRMSVSWMNYKYYCLAKKKKC